MSTSVVVGVHPIKTVNVGVNGGPSVSIGQKAIDVDVGQKTGVDVSLGTPGPIGPPGPPGEQGEIGPPGQDAKWARMTQAEYDALSPKDPQTLYVIIG